MRMLNIHGHAPTCMVLMTTIMRDTLMQHYHKCISMFINECTSWYRCIIWECSCIFALMSASSPLYDPLINVSSILTLSLSLIPCMLENATLMERGGNKSEVIRTPTDDFGDRHTNQLILHSLSSHSCLALSLTGACLSTFMRHEWVTHYPVNDNASKS